MLRSGALLQMTMWETVFYSKSGATSSHPPTFINQDEYAIFLELVHFDILRVICRIGITHIFAGRAKEVKT